MLIVLANLAYVLTLIAFVTRDVLYLRSLLVAAQIIVVTYTWYNGVHLISAWNALFVVINSYMVVQILRERRAVELPDDLRPLHERHFAALSPQEFLRLWRQGRREMLRAGDRLARAGQRPDSLYFILSGQVRVSRNHANVFELPAGHFVAEMSLLTGEMANADVDAVGDVEVVRWPTQDLRDVRQRNPSLWTKIQSVIGHDLVEKIQRTERHEAAS
jgi:CRP-like cAMP-binding protein